MTKQVVDEVRRVLSDKALREEMVETNYVKATRYYGYKMLRRRLETLVINVLGID